MTSVLESCLHQQCVYQFRGFYFYFLSVFKKFIISFGVIFLIYFFPLLCVLLHAKILFVVAAVTTFRMQLLERVSLGLGVRREGCHSAGLGLGDKASLPCCGGLLFDSGTERRGVLFSGLPPSECWVSTLQAIQARIVG